MNETPEQAAQRLSAPVLKRGFQHEALHTYIDLSGAPLYWRVRLKHPATCEKWIRPMHLNGVGFVMGEPKFPAEKPLYLPRDLDSRRDDPVIVTEGEWCCDHLRSLGLLAVTSGSADSAEKADWTPLAGRTAMIWPDNDDAGQHYAGAVAEALRKLGCDVCTIDAAALGLPPKGDAVDWLALHPDAVAEDVLCMPIAEEVEPGSIWDHPVDLAGLLSRTPPAVNWLINERFQMGRGVVITGVGGSSKSRMLYHLAIGTALRRLPWGWEVTRTGKSFLAMTEDTPGDVHRTLYWICHEMGLSAEEIGIVERSVIIHALAGEDAKLLTLVDGAVLIQNSNFDALERKIKKAGDIVFVGLDPALSLTDGDELNQAHQRTLGTTIDGLAVRTGATVALIAHASKASLQKDDLESHNARGAGALTDAVRAEYSMRTMTAREAATFGIVDIAERAALVQIVATKRNHLPPSSAVPLWLRRVGPVGALIGADLEYNPDNKSVALSKQDTLAVRLLMEMCQAHTPKLEEWRDECVARRIIPGGTPDSIKKYMQRLVTRLVGEGLVVRGFARGLYVPVWEACEGLEDE